MFGIKRLRYQIAELSEEVRRLSANQRYYEPFHNPNWRRVAGMDLPIANYPPNYPGGQQCGIVLTATDIISRFDELYEHLGAERKFVPGKAEEHKLEKKKA